MLDGMRHTLLREALEEILSDPDARRGGDFGCRDLHEARQIACEALDFDTKEADRG